MYVDTCGGQKWLLDPLGLVCQTVVSYLIWGLGTELQLSSRSARALKSHLTSPVFILLCHPLRYQLSKILVYFDAFHLIITLIEHGFNCESCLDSFPLK